MKFFHISDLHLGKRVNEFSMLEDQWDILQKIVRANRRLNRHIVHLTWNQFTHLCDDRAASVY